MVAWYFFRASLVLAQDRSDGAMLFMTVVLIHAIEIGANVSGLILGALIVLMSIAYLLMSKSFESFYYFHITIFTIVCIVSLIHGAAAISIVGLLWLVDLIVRYCITSKTIVDGEARVLPGQVTHIRFKKCFPYLPGQYCFLRIDVLDSMQFHPFSLASSSDQEHTSFYCRALSNNTMLTQPHQGDWTQDLLTHVKDAQDRSGSPYIPIKFSLEGPYGLHSYDNTIGVLANIRWDWNHSYAEYIQLSDPRGSPQQRAAD
eukprot:gene27992-36884_t